MLLESVLTRPGNILSFNNSKKAEKFGTLGTLSESIN